MFKLKDQITDLFNNGLNSVSNVRLTFNTNEDFNFKRNHSVEERKNESSRVLSKFPDRIPIICEKNKNSSAPDIDKSKYLVPNDLTIGQFLFVIRKRMHLKPEHALFLFIDGKM
jgi:hypothetical protein